MTTGHSFSSGDGELLCTFNASGFVLRRASNRELLIRANRPELFIPVIDGEPVPARLTGVERHEGLVCARYATPETSAVRDLILYIETRRDSFVMWTEFTLARACQLNALDLFPAGTGVNFYDLVNFRNRHRTERTWPELILGNPVDTSTYSDDWQFAPHPTAFILRKGALSLFTGFLDLQPSFGMRFKSARNRIEHWRLDFGPQPHGLSLAAGASFRSGRLRLAWSENLEPHDLFLQHGRVLVEEGSVADPAVKRRYDWWREPLYCTWGDQTLLADREAETDLLNQTVDKVAPIIAKLDEALVRRTVSVIRREHLPVRTLLLDEGWNVARGDWRPHPQRFPDLRGLVDELHAQGFKVMIWWSWAEIAAHADIPANELAGGGWLNKHRSRWRDYSDPHIQDTYLKPLFRKLFSSDPDCYDLDGVKTDFLADKIHPETPLGDPSWRGEEIYFQKLTGLFYREMCRHKPDALHLGCAGNYWLAEFMDLNRTYDVHSSNWREHEERARMLQCTAPGVPVSYDMMNFTENTDRYFASARDLGAAIEIGNILMQRKSLFSSVTPADDALFDLLRAGCALTSPARSLPPVLHPIAAG
ncbi:MAG: TIM-barrel domain-containing protein [Rariglobus sp.]